MHFKFCFITAATLCVGSAVAQAQLKTADIVIPSNQPSEMVLPKGASASRRQTDLVACKERLAYARSLPQTKAELAKGEKRVKFANGLNVMFGTSVLDVATGNVPRSEKRIAMFHADFDRRMVLLCLIKRGYTAP
jgi:hypothetical protein